MEYYIISDSSVNEKERIGVGCFVILNEETITKIPEISQIQEIIFTESKNSTLCELLTVKKAYEKFDSEHPEKNYTLKIYTDCMGLKNLIEKRKNKIKKSLAHYDLYIELLDYFDKSYIEIIWLKGHCRTIHKTSIPKRTFSILDKYSRKKMRLLCGTRNK